MKSNPFAFLAHQLETHLPEPLRPLPAQAKAAVKQIAEERLAQFDLVPRVKWQAQQAQIAALQSQIAALEARLAALEAKESSLD